MDHQRIDPTELPRPIEPFLRWVGGKRLLIKRLLRYLPPDARLRSYWEPFLGAGSLFFSIRPRKAVLSDLNSHLIQCYQQIRDNPSRVASYLNAHAAENSADHYYDTRDEYNRSKSSAAQAARFIYLNKTCFNGVFRVNKNGEYNVPYGDKNNPLFPSAAKLREVSQALGTAKLKVGSFADLLANVRSDDFIYLDPPYPPLNGTSYFTHYTADRFSNEDQESLADVFRDLDNKGCVLMMTNADTELVRKLYRGFRLTPLSVTRYVTCKSTRHRVDELVITNYKPEPLGQRELGLPLD